MRGLFVFCISFIVTCVSYDELFTKLEDPARTFAAIGIGIMVTISFIKK